MIFSIIGLAPPLACADNSEKWAATQTLGQRVNNAAHVVGLQPYQLSGIVVSLKLRNQDKLDALSGRILANPKARKLSSSEFIREHSPSTEQVRAVTDYLLSHRLSNIQVTKNRLLISAEGTIDDLQAAFATELHFYSKRDHVELANTTTAMVPERLANIVQAVIGLQRMTKSQSLHKTSLQPGGTTAAGIPPAEFSNIYKTGKLPSAARATIGIIAQGSMVQTVADLTQFAANTGFPKPHVSIIPAGIAPSAPIFRIDAEKNLAAWNMVTQLALAAAGGTISEMLLYNTNWLSDIDLILAANAAVADNRANVIIMPFGLCENDAYRSGYSAAANTIFQAGVVQGQTFVAPAGDTDPQECNDTTAGRSFPAASPFVMAIGGSSLSGASPGALFSASSVVHNGVNETAWAYTEGGFSQRHKAPGWQQASGVLSSALHNNNSQRGVPDLSFNADPDSGAQVLIRGVSERIGGTSLSAALFAGFWSRILSASNNKLPFPAAMLYMGAAGNPDWFNDIKSGGNGVYKADIGWDYISGFGSLNVEKFADSLHNTTAPDATTLVNLSPVAGISLPEGGSALYHFNVPRIRKNSHSTLRNGDPSATPRTYPELRFQLLGGTGNGDLYVHLGGAPDTSNYLMKSTAPGNDEVIQINNPLSGDYYVLLKAEQSISNAALVTYYETNAPVENITLARGESVKKIRFFRGQEQYYAITVPEGKTNLTFRLSGGRGDGDLYARFDSKPTATSYDAASTGFGNHELITFAQPKAGTYYLMLTTPTEVRRASLLVNYDDIQK